MPTNAEFWTGQSFDRLLLDHGQAITYTPMNGAAVSIPALVGREQEGQRVDQNRERVAQAEFAREVAITTDTDQTAPFPIDAGGIADPKPNDAVLIDGETYHVSNVRKDGTQRILVVTRYDPHQVRDRPMRPTATRQRGLRR